LEIRKNGSLFNSEFSEAGVGTNFRLAQCLCVSESRKTVDYIKQSTIFLVLVFMFGGEGRGKAPWRVYVWLELPQLPSPLSAHTETPIATHSRFSSCSDTFILGAHTHTPTHTLCTYPISCHCIHGPILSITLHMKTRTPRAT
jgi:hypothetical protein